MHFVSTSDCPFELVAPPSPVEKVSALGRHLAPHYELVQNNNRGSDATNSSILPLHHISSIISQPGFLGAAWAARDGWNGKNTSQPGFLGASWAAQDGRNGKNTTTIHHKCKYVMSYSTLIYQSRGRHGLPEDCPSKRLQL